MTLVVATGPEPTPTQPPLTFAALTANASEFNPRST
jgi:hypothetical protein